MLIFKGNCSLAGITAFLAVLLLAQPHLRAQTSSGDVQSADTQQSGQQQKTTRYFDQLREIPVMPALNQQEGEASVFDKPGGRIVHVRATGDKVSAESIQRFYVKTLPALGWQPRSANTYVRGAEKLMLEINRESRTVILDLHIKPR
jgi:hypothetical protein